MAEDATPTPAFKIGDTLRSLPEHPGAYMGASEPSGPSPLVRWRPRGEPTLTVVDIGQTGDLWCQWFTKDGERREGRFPAATLRQA